MSRQFALVTGASSGLGTAYARELAAQGSNVILLARRTERLEELSKRLRQAHGVETEVMTADLTQTHQRQLVSERIAHGDVHTLINNAGFGSLGTVAELEPERLTNEVLVNVLALTELSRAAVNPMLQRGRGAIVNVASTAAFQPIPGMATYAATKAYVLRFSIALWAELKTSGVRVTAICPGPTETGFFEAAGNDQVMSSRRRPEQVVDTTFTALAQHRPYVVDGLANTITAEAARFLPPSWVAPIAAWVASH